MSISMTSFLKISNKRSGNMDFDTATNSTAPDFTLELSVESPMSSFRGGYDGGSSALTCFSVEGENLGPIE